MPSPRRGSIMCCRSPACMSPCWDVVIFAAIRYGLSFSSYLLLRFNLLKAATFFSFLAVVFYTALAGAHGADGALGDHDRRLPAGGAAGSGGRGFRQFNFGGAVDRSSLARRDRRHFVSTFFSRRAVYRLGHAPAPSSGLARERTEELPQEKSWIKERARQATFHLAVPLLATLGTGPLIAHYFGNLSLAGFVTNPLIVPLVGFRHRSRSV